MNRKETLLYLISKSGVIQGKTRLQKLVFLLQEEKNFPLGYAFYPYDNGPLSFELMDDINSLINNGLVIGSISQTPYAPRHDYKMSNIGQRYVERIIEKKIGAGEKIRIQSIVNQWNNKTLSYLLDYVHRKYPDFKA